MNRRSALKAIAACFAVPVIGNLPILGNRKSLDMTPFCDSDFSRCDLSTPFHLRGFVYATDSRIMVRIPGEEFQSHGDRRVPNADALPWWLQSAKWHDWPRMEWQPDVSPHQRCPICDGKGRVGREVTVCENCDDCYVVGVDHSGHPYRCGKCECFPTGYVGGERCRFCDGDGQAMWKPQIQRVGEGFVHGRYDSLVRLLPNVRYSDLGDGCYRLAFDGGEGLVMGLARERK